MVYRGEQGPVDSIRGEVFREALQDQRALELLHQGMNSQITMKKYPRSMDWLLHMRERVNRRIARLLNDR